MKIKDKYFDLKKGNEDSLILIKSGTFYISILDDAHIMNMIFKFKIQKDKVGFPVGLIDKIKNELNDKDINYLIFINDNEIESKKFNDNKYLTLLADSKKIEYKNSMKKLLFDRIEYLIDNNDDNYDKIRRFIDEL